MTKLDGQEVDLVVEHTSLMTRLAVMDEEGESEEDLELVARLMKSLSEEFLFEVG